MLGVNWVIFFWESLSGHTHINWPFIIFCTWTICLCMISQSDLKRECNLLATGEMCRESRVKKDGQERAIRWRRMGNCMRKTACDPIKAAWMTCTWVKDMWANDEGVARSSERSQERSPSTGTKISLTAQVKMRPSGHCASDPTVEADTVNTGSAPDIKESSDPRVMV